MKGFDAGACVRGSVRSLEGMSLLLRFEVGVWRLLGAVATGGGLLCPAAVLAQSVPVVSQPVVQALPSPHTQRLNAALARLGRDPRDAGALVEAGDAARGLGDLEAAIGFYRRADEAAPGNARAKAGLAAAYVMTGDPVSAIPVFGAAEKAGAAPRDIAADRGLAYDLVGDNATAQRHYAVALSAGGGDEVRTRLALSQAMGGDQKAAEATLMPLLRKQDKPAWRARAFTLAIAGETRQAVDVAESILPPRLAESIAPYLRYMPRLTRAQQAAAANLGRFPRASEIGRDDPRIAAYAPPRMAAVDTALIPKGEPLDGGRAGKRTKAKTVSTRTRTARAERAEEAAVAPARKPALALADPDRVAPPEPKPAIESSGELPPVKPAIELPPAAAAPALPASPPPPSSPPVPSEPAPPPKLMQVATATSSLAATPAQAPTPAAAPTEPAARPQAAPTAPAPTPTPTPTPAPGFDLARLPAAAPAAAASAPETPPPAPSGPPPAVPPAPAPVSLAEVFADLGRPAVQAAPVSGAVDISRIEPPRAEPKPEPKPEKAAEKPKPKKPAPPPHPSRIWVQVGVGRDKAAIAYDWRRYGREAPALFKGRQPQISEMGRTNRILAGPFQTQKAANDFVAELKKAGIEGALPWTSPAGQVVDVLPEK